MGIRLPVVGQVEEAEQGDYLLDMLVLLLALLILLLLVLVVLQQAVQLIVVIILFLTLQLLPRLQDVLLP